MGKTTRICLQSLLKVVNSIIGFAGTGMILYSLWMLRSWYGDSASGGTAPLPWFIYTFLGLGVFFCLITCSGHIAAETANGHCLSCYMVFVILLVVLEAAITADIFLNEHWEADFPSDATGTFDELKGFVRSNFEICKWIALVVVGAQALSVLLAIILRALGPDRGSYYDSDDDYTPTRLPLLRNQVQNTPYLTDAHVAARSGSWNLKFNDKVAR